MAYTNFDQYIKKCYYGFPHNKRKYIDIETASKLTLFY